jgi:hypothetical protein
MKPGTAWWLFFIRMVAEYTAPGMMKKNEIEKKLRIIEKVLYL